MNLIRDSLMEEQEERFDDFAPEEVSEEKPKPYSPILWQKIRRLFFMFPDEKRAERQERMRELTQAIEQYPETAVNYLLRGELHLEMKQYDLAQEDLEKALELAQINFDEEPWGLTAQSTMDRAKHGLQQIR
jgi:tetratricopeptide (TPR) repeat protein